MPATEPMHPVFEVPLRQPDARSCGAAVLVVAQMLRTPAYAETARRRFGQEVLAMHRRVTGPVDVRGRLQLPWPRALGTPPWAVARQLAFTEGTGYRVHRAGVDRADLLEEIESSVTAGLPVALYVGNESMPRHLVLVVGPGLATYEPSVGSVVHVDADDFCGDRLGLGGWDRLWFAILPATRSR